MTLQQRIAVLALSIPAMAMAAANAVDVEPFDVAGVKLGMTPQAASSAIAARLQIPPRAVTFDPSPQQNPVTQSREPKYFTVKTPGVSVIVHFEPRVPHDPNNKMVVSMVIYEQAWTPDNVSAMKQAATEKYGAPSNGVNGVSYQWCQRPDRNPGMGCSGFQGPKLELSGTKLQLENPRYRQAVIDHMNQRANAKPAF